MARVYVVSSALFVKGRLFAAARLEEERDDLLRQQAALEARLAIYPARIAEANRLLLEAQQWSELYEQKDQPDAVPALQAGALPDQAREVPAAPVNAGAALPDVESEGGNTD